MRWNIKDMTGIRIGRWTVVSCEGTDEKGYVRWLCQCDCGNTGVIAGYVLRRKASKSCGCLLREVKSAQLTTHGHSRTRVYRIWNGMVRRCTEASNKDFPKYGGRGITVIPNWLIFENFLADMGLPPTDKHEIDRIDGTKGYCPENCRWVTCTEQQRNRSSNVLLTHNGTTKTMAEWAESDSVVDYATFVYRIRAGWPMDKALSKQSFRKNKEKLK